MSVAGSALAQVFLLISWLSLYVAVPPSSGAAALDQARRSVVQSTERGLDKDLATADVGKADVPPLAKALPLAHEQPSAMENGHQFVVKFDGIGPSPVIRRDHRAERERIAKLETADVVKADVTSPAESLALTHEKISVVENGHDFRVKVDGTGPSPIVRRDNRTKRERSAELATADVANADVTSPAEALASAREHPSVAEHGSNFFVKVDERGHASVSLLALKGPAPTNPGQRLMRHAGKSHHAVTHNARALVEQNVGDRQKYMSDRTGKIECSFTMDNIVDSVMYNGVDLTDDVDGFNSDGADGGWGDVKKISFTPIPGAWFVITGHNLEGNSCKTGGLQVACDDGVSTDSEEWQGYSSAEDDIDDDHRKGKGTGWSEPCTSTSGFYLHGHKGVRKIMASDDNFASFRIKLVADATEEKDHARQGVFTVGTLLAVILATITA